MFFAQLFLYQLIAKLSLGIKLFYRNDVDIILQKKERIKKWRILTKQQLKTILSNYFDNVESLNIPDDLSNSDIKLNANQQNGGYTDIPLTDIYNGTFKTQEVAIAYEIGDYVTINGEGFYVIEDSPVSQTSVKLLAAKNIDTTTNKQSDEGINVML